MADPEHRRLAVLGSPVVHSKSPLLHAAAYRELGLAWTYEAIEMTGDALPGFVGSRDATWRGLSLTMPLKRDVIPLLDDTDDAVRMTGSANTLLFADDGTLRGFNTDVFGITRSFERLGHARFGTVHVLGGGATAATAIVAAARLGARQAFVSVRNPDRATGLLEIARGTGIELAIGSLGDAARVSSDALISTLPNGVDAGVSFDDDARRSTVLLDVAYEPWPTSLASDWLAAGGAVVPGIDMLVHQALLQIRIFVHGDPEVPLAGEDRVLGAMRAAVGAPDA